MDNFVKCVLSDEFRAVIERAAGTEVEESDNEELFGCGANDLDRIQDVRHKNGQWLMALMALTEEEPQDVAMGVEADNGPEAWKRLVKR